MDCSPPGSSVRGIPRQEHWVGCCFLLHLPNPGIKTTSPATSVRFFITELPGEACCQWLINHLPWSHSCPLSGWAAATAKSLRLCPTLCDPMDGSPPGSTVPGTLQARTLEWVAISFSNAGKWKVKVKSLSRVWLPATPWTAAHQAPLSMGFSRQEYWSAVPSPSLLDGLVLPKLGFISLPSLQRNHSFLIHSFSLIYLPPPPSTYSFIQSDLSSPTYPLFKRSSRFWGTP